METKCIGYVRISSTAVKRGQVRIEGDNNSVAVQTKIIRDYCKYKGLNLVEIIEDKDISGGTEFRKREGGKKAQKHFDNGVGMIIGTKLDRFFRSVSDSLITVDSWNNQGIILCIAEMGGASFNTSTATGRLIFTLMIANSEYERNVTGERTKAVLSNKKETGKVYSSAVYGFNAADGKMVINESEMAIVELIKQKHANKVSLGAIANQLNTKGVATKKGGSWHSSTIKNIIDNPIYSGNRH